MIVSTINVNGIRAAIKQRSETNLGLLPWLADTAADVVCLQETRADDEQLTAALAPALADGWHLASADAHLKGRNGVAILSRKPFTDVRIGSGAVGAPPALRGGEFALHGRYVEADVGEATVASVYIQTGAAGTDRQLEKERFMAALAHRMAAMKAAGRDAVVCGAISRSPRDTPVRSPAVPVPPRLSAEAALRPPGRPEALASAAVSPHADDPARQGNSGKAICDG